MNITIEMMDELRKRIDVDYKQAKEALTLSGGDMVEALVYLEENGSKTSTKKKVHIDINKNVHNFENSETAKKLKRGFEFLP